MRRLMFAAIIALAGSFVAGGAQALPGTSSPTTVNRSIAAEDANPLVLAQYHDHRRHHHHRRHYRPHRHHIVPHVVVPRHHHHRRHHHHHRRHHHHR